MPVFVLVLALVTGDPAAAGATPPVIDHQVFTAAEPCQEAAESAAGQLPAGLRLVCLPCAEVALAEAN